jgi:hypothetical protein
MKLDARHAKRTVLTSGRGGLREKEPAEMGIPTRTFIARTRAAAMAALGAALALSCIATGDEIPRQASPEGANVYIVSPADGERLTSPVTVRFGLSGMGVAPAGVEREKTGHHHLLIDAPVPSHALPIPADDHHKHFGGGQTETVIELEPGEHTLQLVLGDHLHVPHDPPVVSERITITITGE